MKFILCSNSTFDLFHISTTAATACFIHKGVSERERHHNILFYFMSHVKNCNQLNSVWACSSTSHWKMKIKTECDASCVYY